MKIYIVRHGQTLWNEQMRMQGWGDSDLTELGTKQAKLLGKALSTIKFDKVISSPLGRTLATTKHILGDRDLDVILDEDFKEMGFGCWEGIKPSILQEEYPEQQDNLWNHAHKYVPIDGESFQEVHSRIVRGLHRILDTDKENHTEQKILLVTHGMVLQILLMHIKGMSFENLWDRPVVDPSSLTIIQADKNHNLEILVEGDIGHLKGM